MSPPPALSGVPRRAWAIVLAAIPLHLLLAWSTDLSPDEAYYLAATRLGHTIHDHPPLLGWLLRWSDRWTALPLALRVRVWPILFAAATGLALVELARRRGAPREGVVLAAWLGSWALLPTVGGFVATPDGPLLLAVPLALMLPPFAGGLVLLAGALAKVSALPIAAALALGAGRPRDRLALALLPWLALPWLWPSLRFQLDHAFGQTAPTGWSPWLAVGAVLGAAGAQAALWSPPVVVWGFRGIGALPPAERALAGSLTALFLLSGLLRAVPPEPNWWAPAALVIVVAFARVAGSWSRRARRATLAAVLVPTALAAAHTVRPFLPLPEHADPTARLHGWSSGHPPRTAPGIGAYGPAAEACVLRDDCNEMRSYFK